MKKIKRFVSLLLSSLILMGTVPTFQAYAAEASAEAVGEASGTTGACTWTFDSNSVLTISGNGAMDNYCVGDEEDYQYAPWRNYDVRQVVIEPGVTNIGSYAFCGLTSLYNISIPDSVTSIGEYAFASCHRLLSFKIPSGVETISDNAFMFCSRLTDVYIPESVTTIYESAFSSCHSLNNICYEGSEAQWANVDIIPFDGDNGMARASVRYDIADSGKTGNCSWYFDKNGVLTISGDGEMGDYSYHRDPLSYASEEEQAQDNTAILPPPWIDYDVQKVVIEPGVINVGRFAFVSLENLSEVSIPDTVGEIGEYAFYNCNSLEEVKISQNVRTIGEFAFAHCSNLKSVEMTERIAWIYEYAFYDCNSLSDVYYPLSEIDWSKIEIYDNNYSLKRADKHFGISNVGITGDCKWELSDDGVLTISYFRGNRMADYGFWEEYTEEEVDEWCFLPIGDPHYPGDTRPWDVSKVREVIIEPGVVNIGLRSFEDCINLEKISISNSVKSIGLRAFFGCSSLKSVALPDNLTYIDEKVFDGCTQLKDIYLSNKIRSVCKKTFRNCDSLNDVYYTGSENDWNNINIEENNEPLLNANKHFDLTGDCTWNLSDDGVLTISGDGRTADYGFWWQYSRDEDDDTDYDYEFISEYYPGNNRPWDVSKVREIIVEPGVTRIGNRCFDGCINLEKVSIADSVEEIGFSAFSGCSSLKSITLPNNLNTIDRSAFEECTKLKDIYISNNLRYVYKYAFNKCYSINDVYYTGSEYDWYNNIYFGKLNDCLRIAYIHFNFNSENLDDIIDQGTDGNCTWTLTAGGLLTISGNGRMKDYGYPPEYWGYGDSDYELPEDFVYQEAPWNKNDVKFVVIEPGITHIGDNAFEQCTHIESVSIPESVESIGGLAFYECKFLENITFPENLKVIREQAFGECERLTEVVIPEGIKAIPDLTFAGCTALESISIPDSVEKISKDAFSFCPNIKSIEVGNGNTVYDSRDNCNALIETSTNSLFLGSNCATIPNGVTTIESYAFYKMNQLTRINIPASVTNICHFSFYKCENLARITVDKNNPIYDSRGNCNAIIETASDALKVGCKNTVIPESVKTISNHSFYYCKGLEYLNIPDGVTTIESSAFEECTKLRRVRIADSVKSIAQLAFYNCENLKWVHFPNNLDYVEANIFYNCRNITDVYFNGTEEEWNSLNACSCNESLLNATVYFVDATLRAGDANADGSLDINDATEIQYYLAELKELTEEQLLCADADKNETVDINDVTLIQKYLVGFDVTLG